MAWTLWAAPAFGGIDVWIYKGPGCALAEGSGLTARYLPASISQTPQLYAIYTPGLAVAFALAAWIGDCAPRTDALFDLAVCALSVALLAPLILQHGRSASARLLMLLLLIALMPVGLSAFDNDRAEPLALLLLLAAVRQLQRGERGRAPAFLLVGVAAWCHPLGGALGGWLLFWSRRLLPLSTEARHPRRFLADAVSAFALFAIPLLLWAAVWWWLDPEWHRRFIAHADGADAGPGIFWYAEDKLGFYREAMAKLFGDPVRAWQTTMALAPLAAVAAVAWPLSRPVRGWLAIVLLTLATLLLLFPYQSYYLFFGISLAVLLCLAGPFRRLRPGRRQLAAMLFLALPALGQAPSLAADMLNRSLGRGEWKAVEAAAPLFATAAAARSDRGTLMVPATHYFLFRQHAADLVVDHFWIDALEEELAGLAACAANRLPGEAGIPPQSVTDLAWDDWPPAPSLDRRPPTLFGMRLRNRLANWSCAWYLRPLQP